MVSSSLGEMDAPKERNSCVATESKRRLEKGAKEASRIGRCTGSIDRSGKSIDTQPRNGKPNPSYVEFRMVPIGMRVACIEINFTNELYRSLHTL